MNLSFLDELTPRLRLALLSSLLVAALAAGYFTGYKTRSTGNLAAVSVVTTMTRAQLDEQIKQIQISNLPAVAKQSAVEELNRQKQSAPR